MNPVATIQFVSEIIGALSALLQALDTFIPRAIATSALITAILPAPSDKSSWIGKTYSLINIAACNFKYAKNHTGEATAKESETPI